jgi:hypothetical protein
VPVAKPGASTITAPNFVPGPVVPLEPQADASNADRASARDVAGASELANFTIATVFAIRPERERSLA